jgi:membrane associated rhomboid family serine protease
MFDTWNNLYLFADVGIVFLFSNFVYSPGETRRRCTFAVVSMFASGVIPNILLIAIHPTEEVYGPSGVVYGFIGIVVGLSMFNIFPARWEGLTLKGLGAYYLVPSNIALTILNFLVLATLFVFLIGDTSQFLSVAPNVNVFGHSLGFAMGFLSAYLYRHHTHNKW